MAPDTTHRLETRIEEALAFDDVLVVPGYSQVLPNATETRTRLTRTISLNIPLLSAAMDTVTEGPMAIAMAQQGGIGVIHKNLTIEEQVAQVRAVKKFESGMVANPITIRPDQTLANARALMATYRISGIPVVEADGKLVGILTNRDVRFATDPNVLVRTLMTHENLVTVTGNPGFDQARHLLHRNRIEKLLVVDEAYRCVGLITVKDMDKAEAHPLANKDELGRLRVAAATGTGEDGRKRAEALIEAGVDVIVVDTAHGHSQGVLWQVERIKRASNAVQVVAGNVATPEGALALIEAGADSVKIGIGPGSICTTRVVAGVGVPQFSAVMETAAACHAHDTPAIADGGIRTSGDIVKAIGAGADVVMIGSLLAGTDEAPGEVFLYQGRSYKSYRGMGSIAAMSRGSADRYFQQEITDSLKLVPEGIEGRVGYKGPMSGVVHQLVGGLKAGMGYTGSATIADLQAGARFRRITGAGLRESHVHDVAITREQQTGRERCVTGFLSACRSATSGLPWPSTKRSVSRTIRNSPTRRLRAWCGVNRSTSCC
jgi:IMP dehydrogenase